jgi:hypothetical protein
MCLHYVSSVKCPFSVVWFIDCSNELSSAVSYRFRSQLPGCWTWKVTVAKTPLPDASGRSTSLVQSTIMC